MIRQGDILLVRAEMRAEPTHKREPGERGHVLAYGEATGHAHVITTPGVEAFGTDEIVTLCATAPMTLVHEEHATLTIPPGWWRVIRQTEYAGRDIRAVRVID